MSTDKLLLEHNAALTAAHEVANALLREGQEQRDALQSKKATNGGAHQAHLYRLRACGRWRSMLSRESNLRQRPGPNAAQMYGAGPGDVTGK